MSFKCLYFFTIETISITSFQITHKMATEIVVATIIV